MKKIFFIMVIGMFITIGFASVITAEPEDPVLPNHAPEAPIIQGDKISIEKQEYKCNFYAIDPDGDSLYYNIIWKKINNKAISTNEPDNPETPWYGPFESGEEVDKILKCNKPGEYELTICAKDIYGRIGPSTTITIRYTKSKLLHCPIINYILENYPAISYIFTKILKL